MKVDRNKDFLLFALSAEVPIEWAILIALEELHLAMKGQQGKPEWLIFAAEGIQHWAGLHNWVLVSDHAPLAVLDQIRSTLKSTDLVGRFESIELCRPVSDHRLTPKFRITKGGVELLVPPEKYDPDWSITYGDITAIQRPYVLV